VTLCLGAMIALSLPTFFHFIDQRAGSMPNDPVLRNFGPVDLSTATFLVLYGTLVACLFYLLRRPTLLLRGLQAYLCLLLLRMGSMALVTLEPPVDLIPLIDPVTQVFYPAAIPFTKDLFFSGHTATMALLIFAIPDRRWKIILFGATVFIGMAVIAQHVHWTIDVLFAPLAAFLAWKVSGITLRWSVPPLTSAPEGA
jgi:hypothetical protein